MPERRRHPRTTTTDLNSDLGVVLDLSPGGMRVLAGEVPDGDLSVTLLTSDGELRLLGRVAWSRRHGFRRWELGLSFVDPDDRTREILARTAAAHRQALAGI